MNNLSISQLIQNNHIIFCDTNVFLRIYDYSPEFAEFAINCLSAVRDNLYLTYTSSLEYNKHYQGKYASAKTKIENYNKRLDEITEKYPYLDGTGIGSIPLLALFDGVLGLVLHGALPPLQPEHG